MDANFISFLMAIIKNINKLINTVSTTVTCGPETDCYKLKETTRLEQLKNTAEENKNNANAYISRAEKNLYLYKNNNNETDYNSYIFDRFATKSRGEFRNNSIEKQQQYMRDVSQLLKQYQTEYDLFKNNKKLFVDRQKQNEALKMKLNKYEGTVQTSERKVMYEYKDMETMHLFRRVLLFFYYGIIVLYLVFGRFIPEQQYLQKSVWIILLIALCIPLMLDLVVKWIFILKDYVGYWLADIPHKDVYIDL